MTDVRLTALNPEDSKVYPVACNSSGELLVDKGEPVGPDLNVEGDLSVGGSAEFAGGNFKVFSTGIASSNGYYEAFRPSASNTIFQGGLGTYDSQTSVNASITADGAASFSGQVVSGSDPTNGVDTGTALKGASGVQATGNAAGSWLFRGWQKGSSVITSSITADGSASFAGIKAGITAAGELIFTSRGVRYKLVVSDGFLFPEPYTREMELKEKLERETE